MHALRRMLLVSITVEEAHSIWLKEENKNFASDIWCGATGFSPLECPRKKRQRCVARVGKAENVGGKA